MAQCYVEMTTINMCQMGKKIKFVPLQPRFASPCELLSPDGKAADGLTCRSATERRPLAALLSPDDTLARSTCKSASVHHRISRRGRLLRSANRLAKAAGP